jgi:hypothetical protein
MDERYGLHVPPHERRPVAWYAPGGLRRVAQEQLWSLRLLRNLDRRETFQHPLKLVDLRHLATADEPDFWLDFLADTGDGGNPTYTVARGVLAAKLQAEGAAQALPEGRLLVLGGDLAYPGASPELYQARLVEMFELARDAHSRFAPVPPTLAHDSPLLPTQKLLAAIPQNHDWFDSASTFCRYFVNNEKAGLVGARAPQQHTYFAFALPHNWFLLGLDFALTGDLDRMQYEAFAKLVSEGHIPHGANVVLVYPEPYWTRPLGADTRDAYPRRYQRLEHLLAAHGCAVRIRLAGDLHHYARDRLDHAPPLGRSADLVTCGSGGAFGHATHTREVTEPKVMQWASDPGAAQAELKGRLLVGRMASLRQARGQGTVFEPDAATLARRGHDRCYPRQATSRAQAWGNLLALLRPRGMPLLRSNLAFSAGLGLLALAVMATTAHNLPNPAAATTLGAWLLAWAGQPLAWGPQLALWITGLFVASDNDPASAGGVEKSAAFVLGLALLLLPWALHGAWAARGAPQWPGLAHWHALAGVDAALAAAARAALPVLGLLALATLACALMFGLFLVVLGLGLGRAATNTSSALGLEDHKGFLRLRIGPDGLEAFMLGCDQVPRRWQARPPQPAATAQDPAGPQPYWEPAAGEPPLRWQVVDHFLVPRDGAA